jgi:hypothetical protein
VEPVISAIRSRKFQTKAPKRLQYSAKNLDSGKSIVNAMRITLLAGCLALAACAPTLHPIVAQPPISDAETVQRLCLDYMKQTVPVDSLGAAIGVTWVTSGLQDGLQVLGISD